MLRPSLGFGEGAEHLGGSANLLPMQSPGWDLQHGMLASNPTKGTLGDGVAVSRPRAHTSFPLHRATRSRACSRSCWTSSLASCKRQCGRPRASSATPWPSWTTPCTSAAPAPQVCPAAPSFPETGNVASPLPPGIFSHHTLNLRSLGSDFQSGDFLALPELVFKGSFQPKPFCDPNEAEFLADYLLSRAEAALESTDALESGHAQYVASMAGTWGSGLAVLLECCCNFIYPAAPGRFGAVSKHSLPVAGGGHRGWSWWVPTCSFEEPPANWRSQRQPLQALVLPLRG